MCAKQTVRNLIVRRSEIDAAFTHLVIPQGIMEQLGPAMNSGKSIFLFGYPGNGKTSIAERIARLMRGGIYVPYAVEVGNQIIKVFDPVHHIPIDIPKPRWRAARPTSPRAAWPTTSAGCSAGGPIVRSAAS